MGKALATVSVEKTPITDVIGVFYSINTLIKRGVFVANNKHKIPSKNEFNEI